MIDRLRELAERPIAEGERPRLFALAVAILVAVAIVLIALGPSTSDKGPPSAPPATAPSAPPAAPAPTAPTPPPAPAERSARRFLTGYLRFVYGRGRAAEIDAAAPALRRRLARSRVRVPPAARRRRPRVVGLETESLPSGAVAVTAEVADGGVARYPVHLTLRRSGGGWAVVEVGID